MRYINYNPETLGIPDDLRERARNLTNDLLAENDPEQRKGIIDSNRDLWRNIKPYLEELFYGKCWYTESPQQGTDVDVDHFRPKKRVCELVGEQPPSYGYWWLAFNFENYRYSCIYANRCRKDIENGSAGGKADHFPLCDESRRAKTPNCDTTREQPVLLDPCKLSDTTLLMFGDNGEAIPRYSDTDHPKSFLRAEKSIELYHLNYRAFVTARTILKNQLDKLRKEAAQSYKRLEDGDPDHAAFWERSILSIHEMIDKKAPYSSFCKAYIDPYKNEEYLQGVL